jgi:perosamine synthetase
MFGIKAEKRDELMIYLKSKGIATGCHYTPLTIQPLFKKYAKNCDFIEQEANKFITLPLHVDLTDAEVDYIIEHITKFFK